MLHITLLMLLLVGVIAVLAYYKDDEDDTKDRPSSLRTPYSRNKQTSGYQPTSHCDICERDRPCIDAASMHVCPDCRATYFEF